MKHINLKIIDIIIVAFLSFAIIVISALVIGYILYPGFRNLPTTLDLFLEDLSKLPPASLLAFVCTVVLLYISFSLILPLYWITIIRRVKLSDIGIRREHWIQNLFLGLTFGLIFYIVWGFIGWALKTTLTTSASADYTRIYMYFYWSSFLATTIIAPISESIWYIGFMFHALTSKISANLASIITALVFTSMHLTRARESTYGSIILFGLFLNMYVQLWLYRRRKSLIAPLGFHMAYNIISVAAQLAHF